MAGLPVLGVRVTPAPATGSCFALMTFTVTFAIRFCASADLARRQIAIAAMSHCGAVKIRFISEGASSDESVNISCLEFSQARGQGDCKHLARCEQHSLPRLVIENQTTASQPRFSLL